MGRKRFYAGVLLFSCALTFGGCLLPQEEAKPSILVKEDTVKAYVMTQVKRGNIRKTKILTATYQQVMAENLSFSVDGRRLTGVYVSVGDAVKKGDLLAELYCDEESERLQNLEYEIKTQQMEIEHLREQKELKLEQLARLRNTMSEDEYQESVSGIEESYRLSTEDLEDIIYIESMQYERLREYVDGCHIYAGIDGTVTYMGYTGSSYISWSGRTLLTVSDSTVCAFQCSETEYIPYFNVGETYTFATSAGVKYETVFKEGDAEAGIFRFELSETQYGLPIGLRVLYSLTLEEKNDVLYLPKSAVHYVGDDAYVYYIGEDGIRQMKYITVGMSADSEVEILDGLAEGEEVILR
ncbi:MAG: biotin/lipoyl-binding protein [Lachnospiraceae bacterium]|nr:biotin/lipoyl-binding protein [Lachnospiraceae bacterium]